MRLNRHPFALFAVLLLTASAWGLETPAPTPKDRCAVCGMFVAPFPSWLATIQFSDGSREFFDGPKDLFVFFFSLGTYRPGAKPEDITGIYVTEYYTTRALPAKDVYFVTGSDVRGPMGNEMVPIQGQDNVEIFRRDHGGTKIMQFDGAQFTELSVSQ